MFNEHSGLVQIWVRLLKQPGTSYSIEDVPNISNLKAVVSSLLSD